MSTDSGYMIVGVDTSPGSTRALQWAETHVDAFGPIQPVSVWRYPWWAMSPTSVGVPVADSETEFQAEAEQATRHALDAIATDVWLEPIVTRGMAGPVLVEAGEKASLIVTGTRGRAGAAAHALGSVSLHCVNHARVPVAVVPPTAPLERGFERVVVGIDGSDHSVAALEWALRNTSDATKIEAVYAWEPGKAAVAEVESLADEHLASLAHDLVEETVHRARDNTGLLGREVGLRAHGGDPRVLLPEAATDADLLVVGARGRKGVAYLLLGSVASAVVSHPVVTTIVVR